MRSFLALLLLLLQLGPMAGAAACLHDVLARASAECPMGEQAHGTATAASMMPVEADTTPADAPRGECILARFCLSTTPTMVQPALRLEFHSPQRRVALPAADNAPVTLAGAPPLQPPIA